MELRPIAYIRTEFPEKFGIPRQSSLAASLVGRIVFVPEYRDPEALRGLEEFSHIWLLWEFSANRGRHSYTAESDPISQKQWQPTVRPPRLGGNKAMGVFATRSPYRPNPIGLSCVELIKVELSGPEGPEIHVSGADLMDMTPIYDIKPYIRYADSRPQAQCGYVDCLEERCLEVDFLPQIREWMEAADKLPATFVDALTEVLSLDPRPSYQNDPSREYGMSFSGFNVRFKVDGNRLTVVGISGLDSDSQ